MNWTEVSLGNISNIGRGSSPRPINDQRYFEGGTIPWIKIADATASVNKIYETKQYVNEFGASFSRRLPEGSLIVAASGSLGVPYFLGVEGCIHDGWLYINELNGINKTFLYYYLLTLEQYFHSKSSGAAIQNINTDILRNVQIPLPPISTQERIASILSRYDDLIEKNIKQIKLLEEAAQNIYTEWFVNFRFPSHEHGEFVNGLPDGWVTKSADQLFYINIGRTPPRSESQWFNDTTNGLKWVSIRDINNSAIYVQETSETISEEGIRRFNMNVAPKDTVILSFKLTVGRVAITSEDMVTNEAIAHFNIKNKDEMQKEYIYLYLKAFDFPSLGNTSSIGTAINSKIVKSLPVTLPSPHIIGAFSKLTSPFLKQAENLQLQNLKLKEARDILLPRLMNRTIEV